MSEDQLPEAPQNVMDYVLSELLEIKVQQAVLKTTLQVQAQVIETLLCAVPIGERPAVLSLLRARAQALDADGEAAATQLLGALLSHLHALHGEDGALSLQENAATVGLSNALVSSAPTHQRQAMRTWLALASADEIAQEAAQLPPALVAGLLRPPASSALAGRAVGAKGKKKPKGA